MLVIIISLALIAMGVVSVKLYWKPHIGLVLICLFGVVFITSLVFVLLKNVSEGRIFEEYIYERAVLVYRVENEKDLKNNELLYRDIVKFNNKLRLHKHYHNSVWIGWLFSFDIAKIDYVEIEGVEIPNIRGWIE